MDTRIYLYLAMALLPGLVQADSILTKPTPQVVKEGEEVIFQCSTDMNPDSGSEALGWYRIKPGGVDELIFLTINPEYDTTKYEMMIDTSGNEKKYDLKVLSPTWQDATLYQCKLLFSNVQATAPLVVFREPIIGLLNTIIQGHEYNITCSVEYGSPLLDNMPEDTWPRLQTQVADITTSEFQRITGKPGEMMSTLSQATTYTADSMHDGSNVTCEAYTLDPAVKVTVQKTMNIQFAVRDVAIWPEEPYYLEVGRTLNCSAKGNPEPTFQWDPVDSNFNNPQAGPVLIIIEQMIGYNIWKCIASNTAPDSVPESAEREFEAMPAPAATDPPTGESTGPEPWVIAVATVVPLVVIGSVVAVVLFIVLYMRRKPREKPPHQDEADYDDSEGDPEAYDNEYKIRPLDAPRPLEDAVDNGQVDPHALYSTPKKIKPTPYPRSQSQENVMAQPPYGMQRRPSQEYLDSRYPRVLPSGLPTPGDLNQRKSLTGSGDIHGSGSNIHIAPSGGNPLSLPPYGHDGESAV